MIKKILLTILAILTIILALYCFNMYFSTYIVKDFINGGIEFKQFFSDFYLPLLPIFSTFTLAIFWSVWAILKVHKEKLTEAKANFSIVIEEKKKQRAIKHKADKDKKIAKLKSKIEKIESDE